MRAALSADKIFGYKHSGSVTGIIRKREREKKEVEMNNDEGTNAVFGCRRACGKF